MLCKGSWDLVRKVKSKAILSITLLRGLITPVITLLTKSHEP